MDIRKIPQIPEGWWLESIRWLVFDGQYCAVIESGVMGGGDYQVRAGFSTDPWEALQAACDRVGGGNDGAD